LFFWNVKKSISTSLLTFRERQFAPFFKGAAIRNAWPLEVGQINFPDTSAMNYQSTLRKIPEEWSLIRTAAETWSDAYEGSLLYSSEQAISFKHLNSKFHLSYTYKISCYLTLDEYLLYYKDQAVHFLLRNSAYSSWITKII
jgi:hypothetical protein